MSGCDYGWHARESDSGISGDFYGLRGCQLVDMGIGEAVSQINVAKRAFNGSLRCCSSDA
jgi:hypothetical protein